MSELKKRICNPPFLLKLLTASYIMACCTLFAAGSLVSASTKGVILTPTRVVFEGRTRSEVVRLINTNKTACTYRVSLVTIRMDDLGTRREVDAPTPEELAVKNMIRFSPRSATIAPGEWQTVRLMVRKPSELAPGEYRAHLKVTPVPDSPSDRATKNQDRVAIQIDYIVAVTIPVIIRHGKGDVRVTPRNTLLKVSGADNSYLLETELRREGLFSLYGNVTAFHTPVDGMKKVKVGEVKGVSIYTTNRKQILKIPVSIKNPNSLYQGKIYIEVVNSEERGLPVIGSGEFQLTEP